MQLRYVILYVADVGATMDFYARAFGLTEKLALGEDYIAMETGETVVARANYHVTYPARFQLVAAMNPCKCGFAGQPGHTCRNGPRCAADYQARISGPLLDRMDIQIELAAVKASDLTLPPVPAKPRPAPSPPPQ